MRFKKINETRKIKVFVALTEYDLEKFILEVSSDDIILTDLYCPVHVGETIVPVVNGELDLVKDVSKFFEKVFPGEGNINFGYVNNFYECSLRPCIKFISTIEMIIKNKENNFEFHLSNKIISNRFTSTYYMAESESIGTYFYDRNSAILPYIINYLNDLNLNIIFKGSAFVKQSFYYNAPRIAAVYLSRFYGDVKKCFQKEIVCKLSKKQFKHVFIVRTLGQANVILPYLIKSKVNTLIINAPSIVGSGSALLSNKLSRRKNITILEAATPKLKSILTFNISALIDVLMLKRFYFNFGNNVLNITQALREVIVMSSGLKSYHQQVSETLIDICFESNSILFSLEQKSPHAWADSVIARNFGLKPIQIKQCNQTLLPLPNPVFSDIFLCDSPGVMHSFHQSWPDDAHKVVYIGTFNGVSEEGKINRKNLMKNRPLNLCFFSGVHRNINLQTLDALRFLQDKINVKVFVKLHPRDSYSYKRHIPGATFIDKQIDFFPIFSEKFDLALTFPSGVVSDLIFSKLPFLMYTPNHMDYHLVDEQVGMQKVVQVNCSEALLEALLNFKEIIYQHSVALENYYAQSGIVIDINVIERELALLARKGVSRAR